jgi:hypothetical protein
MVFNRYFDHQILREEKKEIQREGTRKGICSGCQKEFSSYFFYSSLCDESRIQKEDKPSFCVSCTQTRDQLKQIIMS